MRLPKILLISQIPLGTQSELLPILEKKCTVQCISSSVHIADKIQHLEPNIICFEFDYPDAIGLMALRDIRLNYPSLPLLMFTKNSSECLVTWALRTRVWNYFTKPVVEDELLECIDTLSEVVPEKCHTNSRRLYLPTSSIPTDAHQHLIPGSRALCGVLSYVERNLYTKITQYSIANTCGMSPCKFSRSFKQVYGITFQEYLIQRRITEASKLLQNTDSTVSDVCFSLGFNDMSHFGRMFRRYVGMSPSEFKKASQLSNSVKSKEMLSSELLKSA